MQHLKTHDFLSLQHINLFYIIAQQDLKLKFYQLMIELDQHEGSYLPICKHYRAVYDTPVIKEDTDKRTEALKCTVLYLILAPYDNEQSDLIHRIQTDKNLDELPVYK